MEDSKIPTRNVTTRSFRRHYSTEKVKHCLKVLSEYLTNNTAPPHTFPKVVYSHDALWISSDAHSQIYKAFKRHCVLLSPLCWAVVIIPLCLPATHHPFFSGKSSSPYTRWLCLAYQTNHRPSWAREPVPVPSPCWLWWLVQRQMHNQKQDQGEPLLEIKSANYQDEAGILSWEDTFPRLLRAIFPDLLEEAHFCQRKWGEHKG